MPLHLTKVAFGCPSLDVLDARFAARVAAGLSEIGLTTRYLPKRHAEIVDGSLFWIVRHQLVARSPILGFAEADGGRTDIRIAPCVIRVVPRPRRAHQGWRYLEDGDAPRDLDDGGDAAGALPPAMAGELAALGLL